MQESLIHREAFRVRCYETDPSGRLTMPAFLDLFQEAAWNHARELGLSVPDLQRQGMTWVLFRLHLVVDRYPVWGENLTLETWPSGIQGLRFYRDFRVRGDGGVEARGTTAYMVLDLQRRRPVKLPDERARFPYRGERALDDAFDRLPEAPPDAPARTFTVQRWDVDMNRHGNTTAYVRWCLGCVDPRTWRERIPVELEIHYREECFEGDTILGRVSAAPGSGSPESATLLHGLDRVPSGPEAAGREAPARPGDGVVAAVALSRWIPADGNGSIGV